MYRIIGADGKEYGPVSADQLRQWIAEGRANGQTLILTEGGAGWTPLGALPEFSASFATPPTPPVVVPPAPARRTHSMALAGLVFGILSLTLGLCCYGMPFNLLGLIFSIVGLVQIRSQPDLYDGQGIAIAGIVLSILSLLLFIGLLVFFGTLSALGEMPEHRRILRL